MDAGWEILQGALAISIVERARVHEVDLIAMCTHGCSGLGKPVFGSVADQVVREAGVPVLLVRPDHSEMRGQEDAVLSDSQAPKLS